MALETVPVLQTRYDSLFTAIEIFSLVVFTVEYGLRIWVSVEHAPYRHLSPRFPRLRFILSTFELVDLMAVLPFWMAFFVPAEFRVILVFRVIRFLKLTRYSPGMRSLLDAIYAERRALFGCMVIFIGATLVSATIMYFIERHAQPGKFGTIPDAMWWAIVTLSKIGYGDVVPVTAAGKLLATITIFMGLVIVALPVGIMATAFADQIHRRDFVITWGMVARVPLFADLRGSDIAHIMQLLRAQQVEAGATIVRRGESAHSMYFVADGEVEIELKDRRNSTWRRPFLRRDSGVATGSQVRNSDRAERTSLLVLDADDLHALMNREPRIAEKVRETVRLRLGRELVAPNGDILTDELQDTDHIQTAAS